MTKEKEIELNEDVLFFAQLYENRFRKGDKKYAGTNGSFDNLSALELLYEALEENLDQFSYIRKAIKKLSTFTKEK